MTHQHLNDEQLSTHLDGEAPGDPFAHGASEETVAAEIDACGSCRARLAALAAARALVRRPVTPVGPSLRAEAVASAVAEGLGIDRDSGQPPAAPARAERRRYGSTGLLVGAAAAVLVAVVVALGATHSHNPSASSASSALSAPKRSGAHASSAPIPAATGGKAGTDGKALVAVPDLGSIDSVQALRSGLSGVGDFSATHDQDQPGQPSAATLAPSKASAPSGLPSPTTVPPSSPCLTAAPVEAALGGTATLLATATYDDVPALVLTSEGGPSTSTNPPARLVVVATRTGCRILARTTL